MKRSWKQKSEISSKKKYLESPSNKIHLALLKMDTVKSQIDGQYNKGT